MDLSPEDTLRLNVLLANRPRAIRINESRMTVQGLGQDGESQVKLNPNCRDEQYVKRVKELLSGHVLGSPGGYPVYLQRWTRMGQMRDDNLDQLLLLGEPEAVVAVVCAPGLSDELARRAWWAMEDAENARRMLARDSVVRGTMGPELASYLVEHLPFEVEPEQMMDTVALVLQPGLLDDDARRELWKKAARKNAYYVGFLATAPDELPTDVPPNPLLGELGGVADEDGLARLYRKVLSARGQAFLATVQLVFRKPSNQEVVTRTLGVMARYFSAARPEGPPDANLAELEADADKWLAELRGVVGELAAGRPVVAAHLRAMRVLSGLSYGAVRPALRDTTAIGTLMRRKLEPVLGPLLDYVGDLTRA
ncbi:MAG: sulfur reduction protein DsrS [Pseudomonadota bacterium]